MRSAIWIGLYYSSADSHLYWDPCDVFNITNSPPVVNYFPALEHLAHQLNSSDACAFLNLTDPSDPLQFDAFDCNAKLPFICQINKNQCWFYQQQNPEIIDPLADVMVLNVSSRECAKQCRQMNVTDDGQQCWGFNYNGEADECHIIFSSARHAYVQETPPDDGCTHCKNVAYVKVCVGGSVTETEMDTTDSTKQSNAQCSTNTGQSTLSAWENEVCYCACHGAPREMNPLELSDFESEVVDEKLIQELIVDPSKTSAAIRKKKCAQDQRSSSASIGVLGIALLIFVFGSILIVDAQALLVYVGRLMRNKSAMASSTSNSDYKAPKKDIRL